jgi:S-adenosylmethionine decarboxylase
MNREVMIVGTEWIIDAAGCNPECLRDMGLLQSLFDRIILDLKLQTVGEALWYKFPPPGGITGLVMLTESHIACHTYPEFYTATFNLYCCHNRQQWPWRDRLSEALEAKETYVRVVERSVHDILDNTKILIEDHV